MPDDDSLLAQGTVDFRNEERRAAHARPDACPAPGMVDAFDAGWNAHEVGLGRETVSVLSPTPYARGWALLAYDTRALVVERGSQSEEADAMRDQGGNA